MSEITRQDYMAGLVMQHKLRSLKSDAAFNDTHARECYDIAVMMMHASVAKKRPSSVIPEPVGPAPRLMSIKSEIK